MARLIDTENVLFPVEEHPIFASVRHSNGERRLPVPDRKALVHGSNQRVLGVVSRGYRLVTNQEAISYAYECCRILFPKTEPAEWTIARVDAPSTAGHCYVDLQHNSTALDFGCVTAAERPEAHGPFIRVTNSYNGVRALAFHVGFFRKVCENGLILKESIIRFTFPHSRREIGKTIRFNVDRDRLDELKVAFVGYLGVLRECAVPRELFDEIVYPVLLLRPPEHSSPQSKEAAEWQRLTVHLAALRDRYAQELGENAYAVMNVLTDFASKPPNNRCVRRDRHSLQQLAGTWVSTFTRVCREPGFRLEDYVDYLQE